MVCPVNCHYNCFIRDSRWTCHDAISRVKPRFPPSNNGLDKHYGGTSGRIYTTRPKTHLQGSLTQEQQLPVQPSITALSRGIMGVIVFGYMKLCLFSRLLNT